MRLEVILVEHREFPPPEALQGSVKCFWHNLRRETGDFEILPDGYAEIVFHFGGGLSREGVSLPSPFLMGLLNQPVQLHNSAPLQVLAVRCYPWTVFDLLGIPSDGGGLRLLDHPLAGVQDPLSAVLASGQLDRAVTLLAESLEPVETDGTLAKAGITLRSNNGALPVKNLAEASHAAVRTLERKFKRSSGHTVKDVSAVVRFEQARNRLWTEPCIDLAQLAQELGYTDQSHLSREFKRYSGTTPAAFARKTRREKEIVAFLQS